MLHCEAYTVYRETLWKEYEHRTQTKREDLGDENAQMRALIGDTHQPEEEEDKESTRTKIYMNITRAVMTFISAAMAKRRRMEQAESVKPACAGAPHFTACPTEIREEEKREGLHTRDP